MTAVWAGLATGGIYTLVAIGYNLTLSTAGVLNFAFAHFLMIGSFVGAVGLAAGYPVFVVFLLAGALGMVIGGLEERLAIRPLRTGSAHGELVTTVGVGTVLTGLAVVFYGSDARPVPILQRDSLSILGGTVSVVELVLIAVAIVIGVGLSVWTSKSTIGLASLARSEDREAAMLRGVNVRTLALYGFIAAGLLGGLLGPLVGAKTFASAFIPLVLAIKGFIALTFGGVGSHVGAIIGGLVVGLIEAAALFWFGVNGGNVAVFLIFLAVLMVRPQGLFGEKETRLV